MKANEIKLKNEGGVFTLSMETKEGTYRTVGLEISDLLERYSIRHVNDITPKKMLLKSSEMIKPDGTVIFAPDVERIVKWCENQKLY